MADPVSDLSVNAYIYKTVDDLYQFRDNFFENHSIEKASEKKQLVCKELERVITKLDAASDDVKQTATFYLLKGKALNVVPDFDQNALDSLAKAVKLDPKLMEAWIHLGECYWKKGDVSGANNCFLGALNHGKDKKALRNLSMVVRQFGSTPEERVKHILDGVEKAKEAVSLDIADGASWLILGNAYLSQFFTNQDPKILQLCSSAYGQAEKDSITRNDPDLHYNRSIVQRYNEEFLSALEGFARAAALDPTWDEPRLKEKHTLSYLSNVRDLIQSKGKIKGKKLQAMLSSIKESDLGVYGGGEYTNSKGQSKKLQNKLFSGLKAGLNKETVVLGRVIGSVMSEETVPFTFGMVDKEGVCAAVSVYNIASGYGVKIGDTVALPEPWMEHIKFDYKDHSFDVTSIRVENPVVMVVNGRKQGRDSVAPVVLSSSVLSE